MTSNSELIFQRLLELQKVSYEFNLVTRYNKSGYFQAFYTLHPNDLKSHLNQDLGIGGFVIKQFFFLGIRINKDFRFRIKTKLVYSDFPLSKVQKIDDIEDLRTYIKEYIAYTKRNLEKVKLEKIQWDFNE